MTTDKPIQAVREAIVLAIETHFYDRSLCEDIIKLRQALKRLDELPALLDGLKAEPSGLLNEETPYESGYNAAIEAVKKALGVESVS